MSINGFYLLPHPPIVVPEVGRGEEMKIIDTYRSMQRIGNEIKTKSPDAIILITPHGSMFRDALSISYGEDIQGDLSDFGVPDVSMNVNIDISLADKIHDLAVDKEIPIVKSNASLLNEYDSSFKLDHGAIVPLYFINKYYTDYNIIHITYAPLSDMELYKFGMVLSEALEAMDVNALMIASGDLSHRLKDEGPYDYSPYGKQFDKEFLKLLEKGDTLGLLNMNKEVINNAGECGRRSVVIMLGALDKYQFQGELLSYEGTFGVGYGVMEFSFDNDDNSKLDSILDRKRKSYENRVKNSNPYVRLARENLTHYLKTGSRLTELPSYITDDMKNKQRGVFVSLKKEGELRGCIGTIFPTTESIAEEIIRNSIEAGIYDPRFFSVEKDELEDIDFSVDVLTKPEPTTKSELNPKEYGVIISKDTRSGVLLPDLEGVDTVDQQLSIVLKKAGIDENEDYDIKKFEVIRYIER
ncbi:AmmeMemoRadiSam system protein A [Clostridium sp. D2Q-11]|uniref:AmmeMemoRadiSam system protein A n=1 Tax=Anaeromonas frigoriresistens TaxID=2683708 RepID=A0A942UU29_9FIRM|nr:AmmeMemoRadiSam system protein A [Anaeromonas frigoriresistens]MBS4538603.1 AmmeMemoRadiSam system protein A [Anaeromonas frigoriresistens]